MDATVCERCGETFGCGAATGGCWCDAVAVDGAVLASLAAEHERCLCPACLRSVAAGRVGKVE